MQVNIQSNVASMQSTQAHTKKEVSTQNKEKLSIVNLNLQSAKLDKDQLEKLNQLGGKGINHLYYMQYSQLSLNLSSNNFNTQNGILNLIAMAGNKANTFAKITETFSQLDFAALGYTGKNPLSMDQNELEGLLGENGFFGINQTANRIADFVIQGAGNDLEKLQKGFEGMKRGFAQAEKIWGEKLPQISQDTITKAIEKVSLKIEELGGKSMDIQA